MANPTVTNKAEGTSNLASVAVPFGFTATAGRLLLLAVNSEIFATGTPSGWTLVTGGAQGNTTGCYLWYKIASGGESSMTYTLNGAYTSGWELVEYDNINTSSPLDVSAGATDGGAGGSTFNSPSITPTAGDRLVVVLFAPAHIAFNILGTASVTNGFTVVDEIPVSNTTAVNGTSMLTCVAHRILAADGSTPVGMGAELTYEGGATPTGAFGIVIAAFKASAGGGGIGSVTRRRSMMGLGF